MLVMKFGGTSVGCTESIARVSQIVSERLRRRPVVVVSALAKVTDQLQQAGDLSRKGELAEAIGILDSIQDRHAVIARELVPENYPDLLDRVLGPLFDEAQGLLKAIAAIGELTARTNDRLLGFGERWSSLLVNETLRVHGIPAVHVDASEVVISDSNYSHAAPRMDLVKAAVEDRLLPLVESGCVPVLGGFIGATIDGIPTTLGRGGSDFTASIIGANVGADCIEIWTDVDGMMTSDPCICPDAQNIDSISFEEAAELAHFGAKVLHPQTLQPAVELGIPVYVLNSRHPERSGTRVEVGVHDSDSRLRSIACKRGIVLAEVFAKQGLDPKLAASIFEAMEQQNCLVDLAAMSRSNLSLLLTSEGAALVLSNLLDGVASVKITPGVALVSLVGRKVARDAAISARALGALPPYDVKMIFHGASDMNLSFAVDERDAEAVVRSLHQALFSSGLEEQSAPFPVAPNYPSESAVSTGVEA
jgi:aspartate kinase